MITYKKFQLNSYADALVVTDERLAKLYDITGNNVFVLPCGESAKSFAFVEQICRWFLYKGLQRDGHVVAVGGGSVGDVVGFAASIYMRGVRLTIVPTTLLAMVDSAIGGKTAIDLVGVKNVVGSFVHDDTVVDVGFLATLPPEQLASGMGEIIKYRMLSERIDNAADLAETIRLCAEYKQRLCEEDFYDRGVRHLLNMGHTVGHVLELAYEIPHGIAVANGLYYETELAKRLHICTYEYADKWQTEIKRHFKLYALTAELLDKMKYDKKNVGGKVGFMLPTEHGAETTTLELQTVVDLLC